MATSTFTFKQVRTSIHSPKSFGAYAYIRAANKYEERITLYYKTKSKRDEYYEIIEGVKAKGRGKDGWSITIWENPDQKLF